MNYSCWVCRQEPPPVDEGAQILGVCREHLYARINEIMAKHGEPAIELEA